jgi:hypothetical protein
MRWRLAGWALDELGQADMSLHLACLNRVQIVQERRLGLVGLREQVLPIHLPHWAIYTGTVQGEYNNIEETAG